MNSTDEQWWDLQAAEYVLGSLDDDERVLFEQLLQTDPDVQRRVAEWQTRLDPLNKSTAEVEPSASVRQAIMDRVHHTSVTDAVIRFDKGRKRWRATAIASMALAATIAGIAFLNPGLFTGKAPAPAITVAVLQTADNKPLWAVNYDSVERLSVSVLGNPELKDDQDYQLWMVLPDDKGVQSVGLLPSTQGMQSELILPLPIDQATAFAVSLEPKGGSPKAVSYRSGHQFGCYCLFTVAKAPLSSVLRCHFNK